MIRTCDSLRSTVDWAGQERMYSPVDWHGVSPAVIAQRGKQWNQDPADVPWLDRPNPENTLRARRINDLISEEEEKFLLQWITDGYFIIKDVLDQGQHDLLDDYVRFLNDLWLSEEVLNGLQLMSLHIPGRAPGPIDHAEILRWPLAMRLEVRDSQQWRIHYQHPYSNAAMKLTKASQVLRMCSLILDEPAVLLNSIGLKYSSQSGLHQDLCAYHIHPANRLVGGWLAAENVNPKAGPLLVYPGTHRVPMWPGWNNYPQTNLRTCHLETRYAETAYLTEAVKGITPVPILLNKGDVMLQHSLLIHSAAKIEDKSATRYSMVLHYGAKGVDKMHEVEGPFNY